MTYTILHIDSSPRGDDSISRKITAKVVDGLKAKHPRACVIVRDYGNNPLPHLSGLTISAFFTPADNQNDTQKGAIKASDEAIADLLSADAIVIGVPMWNFGIPSSLKAWIDHVCRAGKTFKYGTTGPEGLLRAEQKVIAVVASGGIYSTGPMQSIEHQESYLQAILGFLGLKDISFVHAEGMAMGPEAVQKALEAADKQVAEVLKKAA